MMYRIYIAGVVSQSAFKQDPFTDPNVKKPGSEPKKIYLDPNATY